MTLQKPEFLKTRFIPYSLELTDPAYRAICTERKGAGVSLMRMYAMPTKDTVPYGPERDAELETTHIFGDQWNSRPDAYSELGFRMFNWYEGILDSSPSTRRGHYLVITDEMREVVRLTHKCGYCGAEYYGLGHAGQFCKACLDSEYLQPKELFLLRLLPGAIDGSHSGRPPLTDEERESLLVEYVHQQTVATGSRAVARTKKAREKVEADFVRKTANAQAKRDGMIWLLDRHVPLDNAIFYDHTGKFCFGWREPLAAEVRSKLLDILSEFPFEYEIK